MIATGAADAVLVPALATFSSDAIVQEIVLWDLTGRGVSVLSTDPSDRAVLDSDAGPEPSRLVIRDVLERIGASREPFELRVHAQHEAMEVQA